jgi:hypothetical protein
VVLIITPRQADECAALTNAFLSALKALDRIGGPKDKEKIMAIHLLPLAKLSLMAAKSGAAKTTGATIVKQAAAISAQAKTPGWLVKGALAGLIGFKLLFLVVLAHKRNVFKSPSQVGTACSRCGQFINLNDISRSFNAKLADKEFTFTGKCPSCTEILTIPDSSLKSRQ